MATEAQLRRRIRELQDQIDSLRHQSEKFQNQITRQMKERQARLKSEFDRALARQKSETEELYTARIRAFQEQIIDETRQRYETLERESARIAKLQEDKIAKLGECNEELRTILFRMKEHAETAEENHREYAAALLKQVEESRSAVNVSPHEFFFQGEYDIIDAHANQIEDEIAQEMYQAASADAGSVMMEFELLRTKVDQALHEWETAFRDYSGIIYGIAERIALLEKRSIQTAAGIFTMAPYELDFWSSGTYLPYKEKIQMAMSMLEEIEQKGIIKYLKEQKGQQRKGIFAKVAEAHRWDDELAGIINCILSERTLSDERWAIACLTSDKLAEVGYKTVQKRFREPDRSIKNAAWYPKGKKFQQNPMDCFDLITSIQGMDLVHVIFVPVRENGVAVRNECMISVISKSLQDSMLIREVMEANMQRVKAAAQNINVSGIASGNGQEERIAVEEQRRKKEPNPEEQIRYLERKYH